MEKNASLFIVLLMWSSAIPAMGMSMRMAPAKSVCMDMDFAPRKTHRPRFDSRSHNDTKHQTSKEMRAIVNSIREAEQTLCDVYEGKKQRFCLKEVLELGVLYSSNSLIIDALELGADPNYMDKDTGECLLDRTERASSIQLLLKYGADPKLCKKAPIPRLIAFYFFRPDLSKDPSEDDYIYNCRRDKDYYRRTDKVFECVQDLIRRGADINSRFEGAHPLSELINMGRHSKIRFKMAAYLLRKLIWRGAYIDGGLGSFPPGTNRELLYNFTIYERRKYNATIGFLSCANHEESPVHMLPQELKQTIGRLVRDEFEFNYLDEDPVAINRVEGVSGEVDAERVHDPMIESETVEPSDAHSAAAPVLDTAPELDTDDGEESESDLPMHLRSWARQSAEIAIAAAKGRKRGTEEKNWVFCSQRNAPKAIGIACCVAVVATIGHSYWKRWCKLKKKRQKKVDQDYNDLIEIKASSV